MITCLFAVILSQQHDVNVSCSTLVCRRRLDDVNDVTLCAHVTRDALYLLHLQQLIQLNVVNRLLTTHMCTHKKRKASFKMVTSRTATCKSENVADSSYMILYGAAIVDRYSFLFVIFALHVVHPLINHTKYDVVQTCMSK